MTDSPDNVDKPDDDDNVESILQTIWSEPHGMKMDNALERINWAKIGCEGGPPTPEDIHRVELQYVEATDGRRCVMCDFDFETPIPPKHWYIGQFEKPNGSTFFGPIARALADWPTAGGVGSEDDGSDANS